MLFTAPVAIHLEAAQVGVAWPKKPTCRLGDFPGVERTPNLCLHNYGSAGAMDLARAARSLRRFQRVGPDMELLAQALMSPSGADSSFSPAWASAG
jgi:hypothetical protein